MIAVFILGLAAVVLLAASFRGPDKPLLDVGRQTDTSGAIDENVQMVLLNPAYLTEVLEPSTNVDEYQANLGQFLSSGGLDRMNEDLRSPIAPEVASGALTPSTMLDHCYPGAVQEVIGRTCAECRKHPWAGHRGKAEPIDVAIRTSIDRLSSL